MLKSTPFWYLKYLHLYKVQYSWIWEKTLQSSMLHVSKRKVFVPKSAKYSYFRSWSVLRHLAKVQKSYYFMLIDLPSPFSTLELGEILTQHFWLNWCKHRDKGILGSNTKLWILSSLLGTKPFQPKIVVQALQRIFNIIILQFWLIAGQYLFYKVIIWGRPNDALWVG